MRRAVHALSGLVLAAAVCVLAFVPRSPGSPAVARNGKIACTVSAPNFGDLDICVMNSDGTARLRMTHGPTDDAFPTWSPDGRRLAFSRSAALEPGGESRIFVIDSARKRLKNVTPYVPFPQAIEPAWAPDGRRLTFTESPYRGDSALFVMSADGSRSSQIAWGRSPAWSPDGARIAFSASRPSGIGLVAPDGTGETRITSGPDLSPAWSPDATRIAFSRSDGRTGLHIYVVNADGTGLRRLTTGERVLDSSASWSPDGTKIAFARGYGFTGDIWVMDADGSRQRNVTNSVVGEGAPDWQPRVGRPPPDPKRPLPCAPSIVGGPERDRLVGTAAPDFMYGLHGDDRLHGAAGPDLLEGGPGDDLLNGGSDSDSTDGGAGADTLLVRDGARDVVICGIGRDRVLADRLDRVSRGCERVDRAR